MTGLDVVTRLDALRLVPVVALPRSELARPLADALVAGGLPCAEITFRTEAAEEAIEILTADNQLLVGAGTILTVSQVDRAIDAGASFIVSPGFDRSVVRHCLTRNVPVIPGVATATEIQMAIGEGLRLLKFFPAEASGGRSALTAFSAAFPGIRFIPTGGIGPRNLVEYLDHPAVAAVGGSWMVASELLRNEDFAAVTSLTVQAVATVHRARSVHAGS
jgi:2-dehydro-3-deoxyphosphogluconate aldolase/(4S)-4-hydroxy-2-oxoglutarate aldolase